MAVTIKWHGDAAKGAVIRGSGKALKMAGEYLLEQANRTVPLEEHSLEGSGKVSVWNAGLQAKVSYDTPYARRQHEDLTLHHAQGRRAKWLQRTLTERTSEINALIARVLRGAF